jgi:hypothetical protein
MAGEEGYAFSLTTFSPSGKLLQIEHALKAVQNGKAALGIQGAWGWRAHFSLIWPPSCSISPSLHARNHFFTPHLSHSLPSYAHTRPSIFAALYRPSLQTCLQPRMAL